MVNDLKIHEQSLIGFYHQVKDKLVPLYKSSVIAWQAYTNVDDLDDRTIPPLRLLLLHDDEDELIVVIDIFRMMNINDLIFFGLPIGVIGEGDLNCPIFKNNDECYDYLTGESISQINDISNVMSVQTHFKLYNISNNKHNNQETENKKIDLYGILYDCNCCNNSISGKKYSCLKCNFDLCSNEECLQMKEHHPHELFENDDYFGIASFISDQCITQVTIHI